MEGTSEWQDRKARVSAAGRLRSPNSKVMKCQAGRKSAVFLLQPEAVACIFFEGCLGSNSSDNNNNNKNIIIM